MARKPDGVLRRGWTTGACATAATHAAYSALLTGDFPDPVTITLPRGQQPAFALAMHEMGGGFARASIIKDAGDDPDVTHLALISSTVRLAEAGSGITFKAGPGVGIVTKPGLPIAVGEPAINPVPRQMMHDTIKDIAARHGQASDVIIEISVRDGAALALKTWNPRLGIVGGLSILGTTGIVIPYSCSAWIQSIHSGIDVARATGLSHVAGCTGSTSEAFVQALHGLPDEAMLDMGDFVGGLLKYLRKHPVPRFTIGGGFGKLTKLAAGHLDLHSGRSQVDMTWLAERANELGASTDAVKAISTANTATQALTIAQGEGVELAAAVANGARAVVIEALGIDIAVDVVIVDRQGKLAAHILGDESL
jgi:cobalt-precorrin-5B (C1)-methyltransferase